MEEQKYADIIDLPHYVSIKRSIMSREARAAQFSPFAALTGYDAAVRETARLTEEERELTEDEKALINEKILMVSECIEEAPRICVTYFIEDEKKRGGAYVTLTGRCTRIDEFERCIYLSSGERILIERIRSIEAPFLKDNNY